MKTAKKVITGIVVVLVALVVLAVVLFALFGNRALKMGIETAGTNTLKVPVSLKDINLSLLGGSVRMNDLVIGNPAGYQHPNFLTMGQGYVKLKMGSLLSNTIEIDKIELDKIALVIEQKGIKTNNLQEILGALPKAESTGEPEKAGQPGQKAGGKNLVIRELLINGVEVKVKLLPLPGKADTITLRLAPMRLENLGTEEPIDTAKLTGIILNALARGIAEQGRDLLPTDIIGPLSEQLAAQGQKILEAGKAGIGTAMETGKGVIEGGKDVGKQATDALKGLFDKKDDQK